MSLWQTTDDGLPGAYRMTVRAAAPFTLHALRRNCVDAAVAFGLRSLV